MEELKPSEKAVLQQFTGDSKDAGTIINELNVDKGIVYRALNKLTKAGYIELDSEASAFGTKKYYKLKKLPNSGITIMLPGGRTVSFNTFLKAMALAPEPPQISEAWRTLPEVVATLAYCAAAEMVNPGIVPEAKLLEQRVKLQEYIEILQQQYSIAKQMQQDEQLWDPAKLVDGALRKTDFFQTPADVQKLARVIVGRYVASENTETSSDNAEGEEDNV